MSEPTLHVLSLINVSKSYGAKPVLDRVSLTINRRDRIGVVGENGAGKTTLARIIMGTLAADSGQKRLEPDLEIGYLPQEAALDEPISVQQFLDRSLGQLETLKNELSAAEEALSAPSLSTDAMTALLDRYGQLQELFAQRGGYDSDYQLEQIFAGLDLAHIDRSRLVQTLSGGEKTRVLFAALLISAPAVLILDEPTNHLDIHALEWLESYLLNYQGALFIISHDRRFLNKIVTQIVELSPFGHTLTAYAGNYDFYLTERERLREKHQQAYTDQQAEIKELEGYIKTKTHSPRAARASPDNDKFLAHFRQAGSERSASRDINVAKKRLEELSKDPIAKPPHRWHINPEFAPETFASRDVIRFEQVSKSYEGRCLFARVNATLHGGDRIVLQGDNGAGKTTLMRLILGLAQADSGTIRIAAGAKIGYLDQEQETLDSQRTVLEEYSHDLIAPESEHRANLHKYGLFVEDQVYQTIGSLSVGQRRKLQIARLIALRANVLLLDEPTNHLDLESVDQFEQALIAFRGTVLAISHDRYFSERVATAIWTLRDGELSGAS